MGIRSNRTSGAFLNKIEKLFFETNVIDGETRLRLVLQREGSQYPDWYSCGKVSDDSKFKLGKDGTTWTPKDHNFPGRSMAMWFFDGLIAACDEAGVEFNEDDLSSFEGLYIRIETRAYNTRIQGTSVNKEKPYVVAIVDADEGASAFKKRPSVAKKASPKAKATKAPNGGSMDELSGTLTKLLEANDGEIEVDGITAKSLKGVVDGDYPTRKTLAAALVEEDFLGAQEVATLDDGVLSAN
jgi:hypothetical protein